MDFDKMCLETTAGSSLTPQLPMPLGERPGVLAQDEITFRPDGRWPGRHPVPYWTELEPDAEGRGRRKGVQSLADLVASPYTWLSMRVLWSLGTLLCLGMMPARSGATPPDFRPSAPQVARGRPKIIVDRVELPEEAPNAWLLKKLLLSMLRREARRADWGAGRGSAITLRFEVTELKVVDQGDVVRVRCTAMGRLPKGKRARGSLEYSGEASKRNDVVERTLEIVARGVITRLAELEHKRRDALASR